MDAHGRRKPEEIRSRFERFFEHAAEAILHVDAAGKIVAANPAFATLTRCADVVEALATYPHVRDLAPADTWAERLTAVRAPTSLHKVRIPSKDGGHGWAQVTVYPVHSEDGTVVGFDVLALDVAARLPAETAADETAEALERLVEERTKELAQAVQELEAFTYTVSHDLRAPLRAIEGFAGILVADHGDELSEEARRVVGVIRSSATRMSTLIDDLLHLTRLGRQGLRIRAIRLPGLVEEVVAELRTNSEVRATVTTRCAGVVHGDPTLLRLALVNLVGNAFKFSAGVEHPTVEVSTEDRGGQMAILVSDNGVGFDESHAGQMFDVFQRLHPATQFPGTGVGLAIVKRVAERHGGDVLATSSGQGATVGFTLPRPTVESADAP